MTDVLNELARLANLGCEVKIGGYRSTREGVGPAWVGHIARYGDPATRRVCLASGPGALLEMLVKEAEKAWPDLFPAGW